MCAGTCGAVSGRAYSVAPYHGVKYLCRHFRFNHVLQWPISLSNRQSVSEMMLDDIMLFSFFIYSLKRIFCIISC